MKYVTRSDVERRRSGIPIVHCEDHEFGDIPTTMVSSPERESKLLYYVIAGAVVAAIAGTFWMDYESKRIVEDSRLLREGTYEAPSRDQRDDLSVRL
tara:strand:- start:1060 stop:1350 length:291 start_codon:yes stop_codon:yes gene_type:complete